MILPRLAALLLLLPFPAAPSYGAQAAPVIGYGSANSVLPAKNQELFFLGFRLAIASQLGEAKLKSLIVSDFENDGSPTGAITSAGHLLEHDPVLLTGFTTSHEALQVAPISVKNKVLTIFAAAGHSRLATFGPYVFTTGESMRTVAVQTVDFLRTNFRGRRGIFFYNPWAVFTVDQKSACEARMAELKDPELRLSFVAIGKDGSVPADVLGEMRAGKVDYVYISMYPDESSRIMEQFFENNIDLPTITNSSWTTMDLDFVRRELSRKKAPIITNIIWEPGSKESAPFEKKVRSYYGMQPSTEISLGYDLGLIVVQVLNRVRGPVTRHSVYEAFHKDPCFGGLSTGRLCFDPKGGHSDREIRFMQIKKSGLVHFSPEILAAKK